MATTVLVRCLACSHQWHAPLMSGAAIACPKCKGPVLTPVVTPKTEKSNNRR